MRVRDTPAFPPRFIPSSVRENQSSTARLSRTRCPDYGHGSRRDDWLQDTFALLCHLRGQGLREMSWTGLAGADRSIKSDQTVRLADGSPCSHCLKNHLGDRAYGGLLLANLGKPPSSKVQGPPPACRRTATPSSSNRPTQQPQP